MTQSPGEWYHLYAMMNETTHVELTSTKVFTTVHNYSNLISDKNVLIAILWSRHVAEWKCLLLQCGESQMKEKLHITRIECLMYFEVG